MNTEVVVGIVGVGVALIGIALAVVQVRRTPRLSTSLHDNGKARSAPVVIGDIPREPQAHIRRSDILGQISRTFETTPICALLGPRGVGKTHVAAGYAREFRRSGGSAVLWVVAEDSSQIVTSLVDLAREIGVADAVVDTQRAAKAALHWLADTRQPALVVLDNAVDPDFVTRWLPDGGAVRVLITSTNQDFAIMGAAIPVTGFTEEQAVRFLRARSGRPEEEDAGELAHELDMMPLALAQAGWVMRQRALSGKEYLASFQHGPLRATLPQVPGDGYPRCLEDATLWALDEVEKADESGLVRTLLEFIALLSPAGVHRALLNALGPDQIDVDVALGILARTSLIGFDLSGRTISMHRLTRRVVVGRAGRENRLVSAVTHAVETIDRAVGGEQPIESVPQEYVEHIQHLWTVGSPLLTDSSGDVVTTMRLLRRWSVRRLISAGELTKAIEVGRTVLEEHESGRWQAGDFLRDMRLTLRHAYVVADQFSRAITLSEQILADCVHRYGEADERTLNARNSLGYDCECGGQLDRATAIHQLNLTESLRFVGPDHQVVMFARVNLASACRSAGDLDRAVEVFEENLRENTRVHGEAHSSTINARGELARTYVRLGRVAEGIALHEQNRELMTGTDNESRVTWWPQYLAVAYSAAGRHEEAIALQHEVCGTFASRYPNDHPDAIRGRLFLARTLLAAGRGKEAIGLFQQTVADRDRVLGPDHSASLNARRNLGLALHQQGKTARACEVLRDVVADYQRVLGSDHTYTRRAVADYANTCTG